MATFLCILNNQSETKWRIKSKALALAFSFFFMFIGLFPAHAQFNFSDQASNYGGTWPNNSNFGTGYNAWAITTGGVNAGTFIGNPSSNGMGTAGIGTTAHGLFGHGGNTVNAVRYFGAGGNNVPMQIGDVFSFHWAMNWDAGGGFKGFDLRADVTNIFNVNNGGSSAITTTNGTADPNYGTTPMLVTLTRTSWTQYTFSMTSRSGGATYSTTINSSANINNINIYCGNQSDNNGNRNIYFNNFNFTKAAPYETNFDVTDPRVLAGTNNLTKTGAGNLTLTGVNTFTGNVIVNANAVIITNDNQLGALPGVATANKIQIGAGTLRVNSSITINANRGMTLNNAASTIDAVGAFTATYNGIIAGTGNLTKAGSGTLILGGTNTYTGTTTISTGVLRIDNINALGTTAGGTTVASGAALELNAGADYPAEPLTLNGTGISNGGALRKIDTGDRNYLGNITLGSDARINVTGGGLVHRDANLNLAGNTLYLGGNQNFVMGVNIVVQNASKTTGDGAIFKDGTGWLEISPQLSMTGNIILQQGIIRHLVNTAYPTSGLLIIRAGTQYRSSDGAARTVQKPTRIEGDFEMGHSGGGAVTFEGAMDLNSGTRAITMANNNTISGAISNGGLTKAGAGSLTLSGSNTYAGNTNINVGNLTAASAGAFGGGTDVFIANGATLTVSASTSAASVREAGTSNSGTVILNTGTVLTINGTNKGTFFQNSISGAGGLTMAGSGTTNMSLFGTQSYTGATTVSGGQLTSPVAMATSSLTVSGGVFSAGGANILGNTIPVTVNGGTYQLGGTQTIGSLTGSGGTVNMGPSTLTTGNNNTNTTYSGVISGTGGLTKIGTGIFTLDGSAKTYTGATTVNNGTLTVGATNVINAASNLVLTNGTFDVNTHDLTMNSINMTGGEIIRAGSATFTLNNPSSFTGGTVTYSSTGSIVTTGTTTLGNVSFNSTSTSATTHNTIRLGGDIIVNNNTTASFTNTGGGTGVRFNLGDAIRTINVGTNAFLNIGWMINSNTLTSGGVVKTGLGRLTLTHEANVYTGPTTITAGELRLNPANTVASWASPITLNGGTLSTTGVTSGTNITNSTTGVTLNLNSSSTINLANVSHSISFANSSAVTWSGTDLTIFGWTGTVGSSGTNGRIFIGNTSSGLTSDQLAKVIFNGFASSATLLSSGELVPSDPNLYFRTVSSGDWNTPSMWEAADNVLFTGAFTPTYSPSNSNSLLIQIRNTHTVTVTNNTVADDLDINTGGVLTITSGTFTVANGSAATDLLINGTFNANSTLVINSGCGVTNNSIWQTSTASVTSAGSSITQSSTAIYNHAADGGTIPISTWNTGSLLRITGINTSSTIGGMGQSFHHVEYNCPAQTVTSVQLQGAIIAINGNFTMTSTGGIGRELRFFANSGNTNSSLTIQGNLIMTGGIIAVTNSTSNGSATPILNINGNLSISGSAIFNLTGNSAFTATSSTVNLVGDLTINGSGTIVRTQSTPSTFRFNRATGPQTYTASTPATAISTNAINWQVGNGTTQPVLNLANNFAMNASSSITVQAGARLNCGTNIVTGNTFTMASGSTLGIGSPQGITTAASGAVGNIQTTTRTYSTGGLYYYMGSLNQVTGNGLPTTLNTLGIETSSGARVSFNAASPTTYSVNTRLDLVSGILLLTNCNVDLGTTATIGGAPWNTNNMVAFNPTGTRFQGALRKLFPPQPYTLPSAFTYPVGDVSGTVEYSPITINTMTYSGGTAEPRYLGIKSINAKQPFDASVNDFLNRHWQSHANWYGSSGSISFTARYLPTDIVGTESNLKVNVFDYTTGGFSEDASSTAGSNQLVSTALALTNFNDDDLVGRRFVPLYFQSNVASGIWESASSWLVSPDPTFVSPPGVIPSVFPIASNSEGIRILNGHNIIYNSPITSPLTADQAIINAGGTLTMNTNAALFLLDGIGTDLEVNGNLALLGGNSIVGQNPTYTATSNLIYSTGTNNVGNEWTGNNTTPGFGVPNDVTILSGTVNMPNTNRGLARDVSINSGTLNLNATSGDLYIGRNWTRASAATFNSNSRAVFFNGIGAQSIAVTGGGTQAFSYLFINKPSGTLTLSSTPATDVSVTASIGTIFGMNNTGSLDLNGRSISFTGTSGNINANGGVTQIIGSAGSVINISGGTKVITQTGGGSFETGVNVSVNLSNGLNFNGSNTTVLGTVRINAGGFVSVNPPVYGTGSTLIYQTGGTFGVGSEWTSTTSGPAALGRPHHVIAQTSTVNMPAAARALAGDLTINSIFNLNTTVGGDLFIRGNLVNNGTLNTNNRQLSFTGVSGLQSISGTAATTIDFLEVNNPDGLEIQRNVTVDDRVLFTSGTLILNNFNLTHNRVFSPAFQGVSSSRFVVTNGTGRLIQQVATLNVEYPIGPNSSSYNPMLINQQATAEQIGIRALITPPFTHTLVDPNQMVNVEYNINESVNGANNIFTQFNWNASNEASAFIRSSGVFHGHWNGTEWAVRPSSATSGSNPYQSNSTVNFTGTLGSGGTNFAIGNINAFFSCILTQAAGNWENPSTWVLGVVPPTDASVCIAHPITVNASDAEISNVVINTGGGLTIQPGRTLRILNNGALVNNSGISANLGSGTLRFNGIGSTSGPNSVVLNNLEIFGNTSLNTSTTVNGNLTVNLLSFVIVGSPIYGPSATLIYNPSGSYNVGNEWTGNSLTPGTGIPLNVTIQNGTTLNMPTTNRGIGGDLNINDGGLTLNPVSGDLFIGGNWTRNNISTTFTPNNRAVFFNGTSNQIISITGGGTETFSFLAVNKPAGNLIFNNSPATNVTLSANVGNVLQLSNAGLLDLNGRTLSLTNNGGSISVNGPRQIIGGVGSLLSVQGNKSVNSISGGTLITGTDVVVALNSQMTFGASVTTIQGTLQIALGGSVPSSPPIYASGSSLRYFTGSVVNRAAEWSSLSGAGYPHHVVVDFNGTPTTLNLLGSGSSLRRIAGNLSINDGGNVTMNSMTDPLVVLGSVTIGGATSGTLTLSSNPNGDLQVGANLVRSTGGTFVQNGREVEMIGTVPQSITNVSNFDFLKISNTSSTVSITSNTSIINRLWLNSGTFDLNGFNINLSNNAQIRRSLSTATMTANPTIGLGQNYDIRYDASMTTGNEFIATATQVRDVEINNGTLTLSASRTFNRDLILNSSANLNLNGFTMTARGRAAAPAFSGSINVAGGGTRNITGPAGSRFDITGLGGNQPLDYTKTVSTFGGTLLNFDSNVTVRIGDGSVDFGVGSPTTINGVLQVLLGGSVGQILNPCFYGVNSILRFANTVDYQVGLNDKTWATGSILSGNPGIPFNVEVFDFGTDLTLDNTRALRGNLTINNGTFTLTTNYTGSFNIGGNWTRTGVSSNFTHNNKLVVFDGLIAGNQFITVGSGVSAETFYDLQISPVSGNITLGANTNLNVLNNLNFTNSKLDLASATNTLRIGTGLANGSITGYDATKYIISNGGKLRLSTNSNGNYIFPIGDATDYTRFELDLTAGATANAFIDGTVFSGVHPNFAPMPLSYINRFWRIEPTGLTTSPAPAYNARYYYTAADVVGAGIIKAVKYSYSNPTPGWLEGPPNSGGGPANGVEGSSTNHNTGTREFEWNGLQTFSDFTGAGDGGPLPITLIAFNAQPVNNTEVLTTWSTASEINNHYFTIYRSKDAVHYEVVGNVDGAGNSNTVLSYQLTDSKPHAGLSYYKLRQTDFNGDFEEFAPVAVLLTSNNSITANVFPNPTSDLVSVSLNSKLADQGIIQIFDIAGALVWQQNIQTKDGANLFQFDVSSLAVGKYIISVNLNRDYMGNLPLIINR